MRLKYVEGKTPVVSGLKRISKPGLRVYARKTEIPRVLGGLGLAILSTSHGIMTGQSARKLNLGGEVLCYVCGRPRAFIRRFALCRICFRERALLGELPGVTKSSW